ncbi:MAG TPA: Flp family type IVb pilin [Stellaceae bacterium]|nr:Flp family type IVb pilin [Stellaceae bacterium]
MSFLLEAWRDEEDGATAIEYALIAALISIIIVGACLAMGQTIAANFFGPISAAL